MKAKGDDIIADAEMSASFLRSLIANGVPMMAAVELTKSYLQSFVLARLSKDGPPVEPWEGGTA